MVYASPFLLVQTLDPFLFRADASDLAFVAGTVSEKGRGVRELGSSNVITLLTVAKHASSTNPVDYHALGMNLIETPVTVYSSYYGNI